jgi:hypothetical protein
MRAMKVRGFTNNDKSDKIKEIERIYLEKNTKQ